MKRKKGRLLVLSTFILAGVFALSACGEKDGSQSSQTGSSDAPASSSKSAEAILDHLVIAKKPTKTLYRSGEYFDPTGMVVTGAYDDGSTKTITDYSYDLHSPLTTADAIVVVSYQGKTATVGIAVEAGADPTTANLNQEGTTRFEAENVDVSSYKYSSANPSAIVERSDASGGKFLAAATGDISEAGYFAFAIDLGFNARISMKAAYAQTEKWKAYDEDMTQGYNYLIDDNYSVRLTGQHILAARENITVWDAIAYDDFTLAKGTHSVKVSVIANTGKGNPNIDYFDFACTKVDSVDPGDDSKVPTNDFHTLLQYNYIKDDPANYALYATGVASLSKPKGIRLDFSSDAAVADSSSYAIQISDSADFNPAASQTIAGLSTKCYVYQNAMLGQHLYYRGGIDEASAANGKTYDVAVAEDGPRNLDVGGIDNFRDCGGYSTTLKEGAKTKQGLFYRGAKPDAVTEAGKKEMVGHLGIKREIDLRDSAQCLGPYIDGVAYSPIPIPSGTESTRFEAFADEYVKTFGLLKAADESPIYLHCTAGADRTGIMAFALMTVLGNSYNDILRDYCFTNFGSQGLRNPNSEFANWWAKLDNYEGTDKAAKCKNWLMGKGIASDAIERIREIFIDGYVAQSSDPILDADTIAPKIGATTRFEAENSNVDSYVISSANATKIVERSDASGGKFLAAATGANSDSQFFTFRIYCSTAMTIAMSGAYAQPEKYKTYNMDMTKTYEFIVDSEPAIVAAGDDTVLDARDSITVWDAFSYPSFALDAGTHTVKGLVVANTGLGNPNIDYFDFAAASVA